MAEVKLTDEHSVALRWVEEHFPSYHGNMKAALILAYGAGVDRGLAEAQEILAEEAAAWGRKGGRHG